MTEQRVPNPWNFDEKEEPSVLLAMKDMLEHPESFRAFCSSSEERAFMASKLEALRAYAVKGNHANYEALCLEGLLHLGTLRPNDQLRLAYLWALTPESPKSFTAACLYVEYLEQSSRSHSPYEGKEAVAKSLEEILSKRPQWRKLISKYRAVRAITSFKFNSAKG